MSEHTAENDRLNHERRDDCVLPLCLDPTHWPADTEARAADYDALVERVAHDLLETDAMTANHDGTPEHYIVDAENVEYLVQTVLDFARDIPPAMGD